MGDVRRDPVATVRPFVDKSAVYRYLRHTDDTVWRNRVEELFEATLERCRFTALTAQLPVAVSEHSVVFKTLGLEVRSHDLATHLTLETSAVWVVICTVGSEVVRYIEREMLMNPSHGVVVDACASALAEGYAAFLNDVLNPKAMRYGPGYGDLSTTISKILTERLTAFRHIGVTALDTGMLLPEKSVLFLLSTETCTALKATGCGNCLNCEITGCPYRRTTK